MILEKINKKDDSMDIKSLLDLKAVLEKNYSL